MMTKIKSFCECVGHKNVTQLAQRKQGDDTCESVDLSTQDLGIDCTMDGYNISIEMLKNIITDKPTPITAPLNDTESAAVQTKSQGLPMFDVGELLDEEGEEEKGKVAKNAVADTLGAMAEGQLAEQGIVMNKDGAMEDPMKDEHMEFSMSVSGSTVDLSKEAHDERVAKTRAAEEAAALKSAAKAQGNTDA